jgi:hypothetical protein
MGIVFGKTGSAEPAFDMLYRGSSGYEIRNYGKLLLAEAPMVAPAEGTEKANNAFSLLAKYIGVFGTPENKDAKPMAMTAPVFTDTMDKGGVGEKRMAFVLPFNFHGKEELPSPTDKRVTLSEVEPEVIAAIKFSGWYSEDVGRSKLHELVEHLREDGISDATEDTVQWKVAQYHPPFTLPMLRRNEIWVSLPDEASVRIAVEQLDKQQQEHS